MSRSKGTTRRGALIGLAAGVAIGTTLFGGADSAAAAEQVSVRLKWVAQAQFAGFYVAKAKGFYAKDGLDMTINPGGPNLNGETLVASGADTFAVAGGIENLLSSRTKGLPLIGIGMMLQRTPSAYVVYNDSGIKSLKDLKGKKVSTFFTGAHNTLFAALSRAGVSADEVTVVPQAVTMAPFIDKQVDMATVMLFNELNVLHEKGIKNITVFRAEDYGVSFPSDTVITNEKTIAERPKVVQAFLNASLRGWKYAIEHPDEAVDIVLKAAPGLERSHQKAMLVEYGKLAAADLAAEKGLAVLDKKKFEAARQVLIERKVIENPVPVEKAIDERFWNAVPDADKKL
jgi:NitT/TauT family transport system substrate-binding protein